MIADKKTQLTGKGVYKTHKSRLYRNHNLLIFLTLTGIAYSIHHHISRNGRTGQYMAESSGHFAAITGTNKLSSG